MLLHYHIPKTAGTSIKRVLESWYKLVRDGDLASTDVSATLEGASEYCVTGHFSSSLTGLPDSLLTLLPQVISNPDFQVFTVLRDPIEHLISTYYHHQGKAPNKDIGALTDFVFLHNRFLYRHSLQLKSAEDVSAALRSFFFIGDARDTDRAMHYLSELLDQPYVPPPRQNIGDRDLQILSLSAADRSRLEQALSVEYEVYVGAQDMLAKKAFTGNPAERLHQFAYVELKNSDPFPGPIKLADGPVAIPEHPEPGWDAAIEAIIRKKDERISEQTAQIDELSLQCAALKEKILKQVAQKESIAAQRDKTAETLQAFRQAAETQGSKIARLRADNAELVSTLSRLKSEARSQAEQIAQLKVGLSPHIAVPEPIPTPPDSD
jgi:hypothetical protein